MFASLSCGSEPPGNVLQPPGPTAADVAKELSRRTVVPCSLALASQACELKSPACRGSRRWGHEAQNRTTPFWECSDFRKPRAEVGT
eukprot:12915858-Alexandrium_andersonii.AAC.1